MTEESKEKKDLLLPFSIIIAAVLIAGSVIWSAGNKSITGESDAKEEANLLENAKGSPDLVNPITTDDHIRGNPQAPVKIIEFSDLECPYCKAFHNTMREAMSHFGDDVAWIYRHRPLDGLHTQARREAQASECVAEQGGNEAFWDYIDKIFEVTPSNDGLNLDLLPEIAGELGLDVEKFNSCLKSGRFNDKIDLQIKDAVEAGGIRSGTPFSVVIGKNKKLVIPGALPFVDKKGGVDVKSIIEEALR